MVNPLDGVSWKNIADTHAMPSLMCDMSWQGCARTDHTLYLRNVW